MVKLVRFFTVVALIGIGALVFNEVSPSKPGGSKTASAARPEPGPSPSPYYVTHSHLLPGGGSWQNVVLLTPSPTEAQLRDLVEWYRLAFAADRSAHLVVFDDSSAAFMERVSHDSLTATEQQHYARHLLAVYTKNGNNDYESATFWPDGANGRALEMKYSPARAR